MSDPRREDWLAQRRELLTASDCGAVLGFSRRRGPLSVWLEKVEGYAPDELLIMRRGLRMEPVIAAEYVEATGRPVIEPPRYEIVRHPDLPWLGATLDRKTAGNDRYPAPADGVGPLELKNVSGMKAAAWREEPPIEYQIQAQVQIACTGAQWASLAAMIAGQALAWHDMPRHDRFLAQALPALEAFWLSVKRREPPSADALPGTSEALKAVYAKDDGETVALDHDALALMDALEGAQVERHHAERSERHLDSLLRARMGAATWGALPDGTFVALPVTQVRGYTKTVEPNSYRRLRRYRPRLLRRNA